MSTPGHRRLAGLSLLAAAIGLAVLILVTRGGEPPPATQDPPSAASPAPVAPVATTAVAPRLFVIVSVDWEGRDLQDVNFQVTESFRRSHPQVVLTHFLNAAYFTKEGADATSVTASMRRIVEPRDEIGLHIHAWQSLVEAAGVVFRDRPTFWGGTTRWPDATGDVGHDVELTAYSVDEVRSIVIRSREILGEHGFALSPSFRAGGWLASEGVLEAIRLEGFLYDSSATVTTWHDEIATFPLVGRMEQLWGEVRVDTPPFAIQTRAGEVLEVPDTGAMADYLSAEEMTGHLREALTRLRAESIAFEKGQRAGDVLVQFGFHLETAARFLPGISEALAGLDPSEAGLVFATVQQVAEEGRWITLEQR